MIGNCNPGRLRDYLAELGDTPLSVTEKGFTGIAPITPAALAALGVSVWEAGISTPMMVLHRPELLSNIRAMAAWCSERELLLAPQAKTTMAPQIIVEQLAAGAWAITVADVNQLRALYHVGVRRLIVANEVTDDASLRWLGRVREADPELDVACYIDSRAGVDLLAGEHSSAARPMPVLIELGVPGERTGVRDLESAVELSDYARGRGLLVCGVAAFEGVLGRGRTPSSLEAVSELCQDLHDLGKVIIENEDVDPEGQGFAAGGIVSAGSSRYFDVVAEALASAVSDGLRVVLSSGGFLVPEPAFLGARSAPVNRSRPALEIWASVLSRPEGGLALLNAGKLDLPEDLGLPTVIGMWRDRSPLPAPDAEVFELNDHHGFLRLAPSADVRVGDVLVLGSAQPCCTFDRWRSIPVLDAEDRIVDVVRTLL